MAKQIIKRGIKETIKKFKPNPNAPQSRAISGIPEKGTVGAQKTPKAKATPATTKGRGRPKGSTNKAKASPATGTSLAVIKPKTGTSLATTPKSVVSTTAGKIPTATKVAAVVPAAGLTALAVNSKRKKPASEASKVTFGEAFKAARKKGEGTKFTWEGKQYTAVTKDDLNKKGYDANELRQYANRKGKARGPLNRLGQKAKKVLLGKDKKFGGDKGAIDFIRRPKKKASGGMANSSAPKKFKAGGMATKGLGKAYMNSKK